MLGWPQPIHASLILLCPMFICTAKLSFISVYTWMYIPVINWLEYGNIYRKSSSYHHFYHGCFRCSDFPEKSNEVRGAVECQVMRPRRLRAGRSGWEARWPRWKENTTKSWLENIFWNMTLMFWCSLLSLPCLITGEYTKMVSLSMGRCSEAQGELPSWEATVIKDAIDVTKKEPLAAKMRML